MDLTVRADKFRQFLSLLPTVAGTLRPSSQAFFRNVYVVTYESAPLTAHRVILLGAT